MAELQSQFFKDNLEDLKELKQDLGIELKTLTGSVAVTVVAGAGTLAANLYPEIAPVLRTVITAAGTPLTLGGAVSAANKLFRSRRKLLRAHPLAFLYELRHRRNWAVARLT